MYDRYLQGYVDVYFPFDWNVSEPADDWHYRSNSPYCKEDFKKRKAPCVIAIPGSLTEDCWDAQYSEWVGADGIVKIYFNDTLEDILKKFKSYKINYEIKDKSTNEDKDKED